MKRYLLFLICALVLTAFPGCKKKSGFDPLTKSQSDFIGTWKGTISSFKDNKLIRQSGNVVFYPEAGGESLAGLLFMKENIFVRQFQFANGTVYFNVICNDPENPNCQNWSLSGYAVFSEEGKIELNISGNECGLAGNQYISWEGTMQSTQVAADSIRYFDFGRTGNTWTYNVRLQNGDSCLVQKQINQNPADYFFQGASSQACAWGGINKSFSWTVSPDTYTLNHDSTFSLNRVYFPIYAKPGVTYKYLINSDTTTVTLVDTSVWLTTPAGTFSCFRFRHTEPFYSGMVKNTKTSHFWINNRYGIIRQEVANPVDSTSIQLQVLAGKNF